MEGQELGMRHLGFGVGPGEGLGQVGRVVFRDKTWVRVGDDGEGMACAQLDELEETRF